jgi:tetratricopeptide (TPR) repeat protein
VVAAAAGILSLPRSTTGIQFIRQGSGELLPISTPAAFVDELPKRAQGARELAQAAFAAGEVKLRDEHYKEAATDFRSSITALPTASAYVDLSYVLIRLGSIREARTAIDEGLALERREASELKAALLNARAVVLGIQGRPIEAEEDINAALGIFRHDKNKLGVASCVNDLAVIMCAQRNEVCENQLRSALDAARATGEPARVGTVLNNLANHYRDTGRVDEARSTYSDAITAAEHSGDVRLEAIVTGNIGRLSLLRGDIRAAHQLILKSAETLETLGDRIESADAFNNLAVVQGQQGDVDGALRSLQKVLQTYEEAGLSSSAAYARVNIGFNYFNRGDYDRALREFVTAKSLPGPVPPQFADVISINIASVYFRRHLFDDAANYFQQAVANSSNRDDFTTLAAALNGLGAVFREQGKMAAALRNFKQASVAADRARSPLLKADAIGGEGLVYARAHRNIAAAPLLKQAVASYVKSGANSIERRDYERALKSISR